MRLPWRTAGLCLLLAILHGIAGPAPEMLVFNREAVLAGEYWRLISGHLVHSDLPHLGWNLAALAAIGTIFEQRLGARIWPTLAAGMLAIDALLLGGSGPAAYCGLSGVLNTLLAVLLAHWLGKTGDPMRPWAAITLIGMLVKIAIELQQGQALLTHTAWPAYPPAHLAGALAALPVGLIWSLITKAGYNRDVSLARCRPCRPAR